MVDTAAFVSAGVINGSIFLFAVVLFSILRRKYKAVYQPRCNQHLYVEFPQQKQFPVPLLPEDSIFGWIKATVGATEFQLLETAGLDAFMLVRVFRLGLILFGVACILAVGLLLPIYIVIGETQLTDVEKEDLRRPNTTASWPSSSFTDVDTWTLANMPDDSYWLWATVGAMYVLSGVALYLLYDTYRVYSVRRQVYLRDANAKGQSMTVLVENVPSVNNNLAAWYRHLYPESAVHAHLAQDTHELQDLLEQRKKILRKYEQCYGVLASNKRKEAAGTLKAGASVRPRHKLGALGLWGLEVDSLDQYEKELAEINDQIGVELRNNTRSHLSAGFVTLSDPVDVMAAAQVKQSATPFSYKVTLAPEPRDVYWPNLGISSIMRELRERLTAGLTLLLMLFWVVPVAIVASLTTLEALSDRVPFLEFVTDLSPPIRGFLEGFLPTLALTIFLIILPILLASLSKLEGRLAWSSIARGVFEKYFYFQAIHNFLLITLAGSVLQQIDDIIDSIDDPTVLIELLAQSLPQYGMFFTLFVMLNAFSLYPLRLLNVAGVIVSSLKKKYLVKTDRARRAVHAARALDYGVEYSRILLIFVICLAYATISPLISVFGFVFFGIGWLVMRYHLLFVYVNQYESGGRFWPLVHTRIASGVILAQLTVTGVFGLKQSPWCAIAMIPLICATIVASSYTKRAFFAASEHLSTEEAIRSRISCVIFEEDQYVQRELRAKPVVKLNPNVGDGLDHGDDYKDATEHDDDDREDGISVTVTVKSPRSLSTVETVTSGEVNLGLVTLETGHESIHGAQEHYNTDNTSAVTAERLDVTTTEGQCDSVEGEGEEEHDRASPSSSSGKRASSRRSPRKSKGPPPLPKEVTEKAKSKAAGVTFSLPFSQAYTSTLNDESAADEAGGELHSHNFNTNQTSSSTTEEGKALSTTTKNSTTISPARLKSKEPRVRAPPPPRAFSVKATPERKPLTKTTSEADPASQSSPGGRLLGML